jgi:hypothetical protein
MQAKIPERLLRCRRRAAAASHPLADPDTVANMSFGIGTGRRAAQCRVLGWSPWSCAPTLPGIKWNKSSLVLFGPRARLTSVFHPPQLFSQNWLIWLVSG